MKDEEFKSVLDMVMLAKQYAHSDKPEAAHALLHSIWAKLERHRLEMAAETEQDVRPNETHEGDAMKTEKFEAMLAGMERLTAGDRKELLARWRDLVEAQQGSEAMAAETLHGPCKKCGTTLQFYDGVLCLKCQEAESKPALDIPGPTVPLDERLGEIEKGFDINVERIDVHRVRLDKIEKRLTEIERVAKLTDEQVGVFTDGLRLESLATLTTRLDELATQLARHSHGPVCYGSDAG